MLCFNLRNKSGYFSDHTQEVINIPARLRFSEKNMSLITELKSWSWIFKTWIIVYPALFIVGMIMGTLLNPNYYWIAIIIGVPFAVIPITYRNLVGGGCSLRFQICALVKGILAGSVFLILALAADSIIWQVIGPTVGWSPMTFSMSQEIYLIWFLSGTIGGFGARIVEVRAQARPAEIRIAGFK